MMMSLGSRIAVWQIVGVGVLLALAATHRVALASPDFAALEEVILGSVVSTSLIENLDFVHLIQLHQQQYDDQTNGTGSSSTTKDAFSEAVDEMVNLRSVYMTAPPACDEREMSILKQIGDVTNLHRFVSQPEQSLSRINWIIHRVSKLHARACMLVYPQKFHYLLDLFDQRSTNLVHEYMQATIVSGNRCETMDCERRALEADDIEFIGDIATAIEHIYRVSAGDQRARDLSDDDRADYLFTHYLGEPCKDYCNHFGPNLFEPFKYDLQMFESPLAINNIAILRESLFFQGLAIYKMCCAIKNDPSFQEEVVYVLRHQY